MKNVSHYYRIQLLYYFCDLSPWLDLSVLKYRDRVNCHFFDNTDICILDTTQRDAITTKKTLQGEEWRRAQTMQYITH